MNPFIKIRRWGRKTENYLQGINIPELPPNLREGLNKETE